MTSKNTLQPTENNVPRHVAIILDGNRRFAKKLMIKPWKGHEWGAEKVRSILEWIKEIKGIQELTLYCFSIENFERPKDEFAYLMNLFKEEFRRFYDDERLVDNQIKIRFIGRISMFPQEIQDLMHRIMEKTKEHSRYVINFAMAYGGRTEIIDAVQKIAAEVEQGRLKASDINQQLVENHLYMADEPDLIIRTGGEKRSSNFLCYQSAYSEWVYLEKMWPEFEKKDFLQCIEEFKERKRRFGK